MAIDEREKPVFRVARAAELTSEAAAKAAAAVQELQRVSSMATMVARVATAVAQSANVSDLTAAVLDETLGTLGSAACCIFLADVEHRRLDLANSRGLPADVVKAVATVPFDSPSVIGKVARTLVTQLIDDVREYAEPPLLVRFLVDISARGLACVPLVAAEELVGVLLSVVTHAYMFSAEDLATLEVVASTVGSALANALARDRLARESARLRTILENTPHGIVFLDRSEQRATSNPAVERLLGVLPTNVPFDRTPVRTYRPDGRPIADDDNAARRALRGESVSHEEVIVEAANGKRLSMLVSATPIIGRGGEIDSAVIAFEDISVLKELDRLREEFAAIVAHDLRNPISAVLMTAEMMLGRSNEDPVLVPRSQLERIHHSAARLGDMVKDLLDASRIDIGELALQRTPVDAAATIRTIVAQIQPTLGEHRVEIDADLIHSSLTVDPLRFEQVFTNLLENAARYSPDGAPIAIRVRAHEGGLLFSVVDRGIGIAPDKVPRLFDRFYQAKRARQMRKGLGLGLYIAKGLVEAHGGRITVESTPGEGSAFHVWLPFT